MSADQARSKRKPSANQTQVLVGTSWQRNNTSFHMEMLVVVKNNPLKKWRFIVYRVFGTRRLGRGAMRTDCEADGKVNDH